MTQNNDWDIVPLTGAHIPQMAEMEKLCFSMPWSEEMLQDEVDNPLAYYVVAQCAGQVLGYIGTRIILDTCEITNVAVHPDCRRRGIAHRLLCALEDYCRAQAVDTLCLEVRLSNDGARALYEGHGFSVVGCRLGYYKLPTEDALLLRKTLAAPQNEEKEV